MYMVAFMYPNKKGATFNFEHFVKVHLPLGLHQTFKHLGIKPVKLVVYSPTWNVGDPNALAALHCHQQRVLQYARRG